MRHHLVPIFAVWSSCAVLTAACTTDVVVIAPTGHPGETVDTPPSCIARPTSSPLRRLTPVEYENTVRDLFPGVSVPAVALIDDTPIDGFDNNALGQAVTSSHIEDFQLAAAAIAQAASAQPSWLSCSPTPDPAACARTTATTLATRVYRRPLRDDEATRLQAFIDAAQQADGFDAAIAELVEGLLQTPQFLYRAELGDPNTNPVDGVVPVTGFEMATRLSYFLWRTMPDADLMAAAASGTLDSEEGVAAEAARMLQDERARATVASFHRQWLGLDRLQDADISPEQFPELTSTVRSDLDRGMDAFLDKTFWGSGSFADLFTSTSGFVTDATAPLYGVPAPGSADPVEVALPASERAGVLTQPGMLTSTSHGISHSAILRGVVVMKSILCMDVGAPPPGVSGLNPDPTPGTRLTAREQVEKTHAIPECLGCHNTIDGLGFTFENYDALGRYRTHDDGLPVDPSGRVQGTLDSNGPVHNAIDLSQRLSHSAQVQDCLAAHWFRFGTGHNESGDGETCEVAQLGHALRASHGDMRAVLRALVTSPAFRSRVSEGAAP